MSTQSIARPVSRLTLAIPTEESTRVLPATAYFLPGVGMATPYETVGDAARQRLFDEGWQHVRSVTRDSIDYDTFRRVWGD